ncbi:MAG: PH domain-containing protein [Ruminococcus sp.]|nr:PH domain-containing protein [Ruminococcus sp.]
MIPKQYSTPVCAVRMMQGLTLFLCLGVCSLLFHITGKRLALIVSGACFLVWIAGGLFCIPEILRRIRILIDGSKVTISSGIFFRRTRTLLLHSLQLTILITTPFSRYTGINFLLLRSYGGTLLLPFLSRKDAESLHKELTVCLLNRSMEETAGGEVPHVP